MSNVHESRLGSAEAGAPDNEIEITMIEAGVSVLLAADYRFESHADVVRDILHAARNSQSGVL